MGNRNDKEDLRPESDPDAQTDAYAGSDRRQTAEDLPETHSEIRFDDKGNPVWEVRASGPRRRKDDDTIDLLKTLDLDSLSLEEEEEETDAPGYDPYGHLDKR